jgi:hypothetical protein
MKRQIIIFALFAFLFSPTCSRLYAQYPSVIEIITKKGTKLSVTSLQQFCKVNKLDPSSLFVWNNHWVLYSRFDNIDKLKAKLKAQYPAVSLKLYRKPFYVFNRKRCDNGNIAKEWANSVMTANLVKDTVLQKQYMEYHRTQFEKWPEVARGFCNANFQQLLVFRTGRQLMLIISIPKGEDLDKLNPKTSENNPRVDEWNKTMSKYQEGLEDAPKGDTWEFFKAIAP